jgi:Chaperone of endosialidase
MEIKNMTTLHLRKSINRSRLRRGSLLIPLALGLACFELSPSAQAVCQQGCQTNENTVLGDDALVNNTTGIDNTAVGFNALNGNTTGQANTANGYHALLVNTTGGGNTANGALALESNTTGYSNTATGVFVLQDNTTDYQNTATGEFALPSNTTGFGNTANGFEALFSNTTGVLNTANGAVALSSNTTGFENTAEGDGALARNTTGNGNIALGFNAGVNLTTGNNNIDIGNVGVAGESKTIRIGKAGNQMTTFIAGISGGTVPEGVGVIVDTRGHLGTIVSSERFKDNIKPMDKASEAILALQPATFRYKKEFDPGSVPQFGLVAEQVEKVDPDLVARDEQGKPYTVRYEAVNAMLLNEFLKEHRKVEELEATIARLTGTVKEQGAQIQKVSAQLEVRKTAPQIVLNNQ